MTLNARVSQSIATFFILDRIVDVFQMTEVYYFDMLVTVRHYISYKYLNLI